MMLDPAQEAALYRLRMMLKALWGISMARKDDAEAITVNAAGLSGLFEMLSLEVERIDPAE